MSYVTTNPPEDENSEDDTTEEEGDNLPSTGDKGSSSNTGGGGNVHSPGGNGGSSGSDGNTRPVVNAPRDTSNSNTLERPAELNSYQFVKGPDAKRVFPGDLVTYTFAHFGNNRGVPLDRFTIMDRPDRGIDFVSISLPAFKNGENASYSICYFTVSGGGVRNAIAEDVPANRASSFRMPRTQPGDYVTMVAIEFGTVPAGFAVGDTFQMIFRVWDHPPARVLENIGILSYSINERYYEFVTCSVTGSVVIGGWFGSPQTGDERAVVWHMLGATSLFILFMKILKN